jgi:hypothetical protein
MVTQKQMKRLNYEVNLDFDDLVMNDIIINNTITLYHNDRFIDVELSTGWPFHPFKNLWINNKSVKLNPIPCKILSRYRKNYGHKCPCCEVLLCGNNWSPAIRIKHIIDQYDDTMSKFNKLYYDEWFDRLLCIEIPEDIKNTIKDYLC